jgi:GTP-binding protein EngB required for normal cell division
VNLYKHDVPFVVVATKVDKLNRDETEVRRLIGEIFLLDTNSIAG